MHSRKPGLGIFDERLCPLDRRFDEAANHIGLRLDRVFANDDGIAVEIEAVFRVRHQNDVFSRNAGADQVEER